MKTKKQQVARAGDIMINLGALCFLASIWFFNMGVGWKMMWTGGWVIALGFLFTSYSETLK